MRSFIFILIAALFMGSAAYLGNMLLFPETAATPAQSPAHSDAPVRLALRVTAPLMPGDLLAPHLLEWRAMPEGGKGVPFFREEDGTIAALDRAVLVRARKSGEYLEQTDLIRPGDAGYEKALLRPGARAQALNIANRGDFDGLRPGDHADLILSFTAPEQTAKAGETLVRRVAENIRITAVSEISRSRGTEGRITVALPEGMAERVTLAARLGSLSIAPYGYRAGSPPEDGKADVTLSLTDLFPDLAKSPAKPRPSAARQVTIMRGGETSVQTLSGRSAPPPATAQNAGGS